MGLTLTELVTKYTKDSPRMNAWLAAMNYQAGSSDGLAPFKTSGFSYPGWFSGRQAPTISFVNQAGGSNYTRAFVVTTAAGQTVTTPVAPASTASDVTPAVTPPNDGDQVIGLRRMAQAEQETEDESRAASHGDTSGQSMRVRPACRGRKASTG